MLRAATITKTITITLFEVRITKCEVREESQGCNEDEKKEKSADFFVRNRLLCIFATNIYKQSY